MRITAPDPAPPASLADYPAELLTEIYRRMFLIRHFELTVNDLFLRGLMPGTIHLSHGQEATAVGACLALQKEDVITLTHRGHGQALAKGVSPRSLMAELFGKATGCCQGKGGSLHVGDISVGALPAIAIVGASSPVAAGMAFAFKRRQTGQIVCNFFGDGAVNKGDWHEAMNIAAVWALPVVFLCENNLYGVSTHITDTTLNEYLSERAAAYRMPAVTVYGNDPIPVYEAMREASLHAREGKGPTMVECLTYRRGGHKRDDTATYRPQDEVEAWLAQDPLPAFRQRLLGDARFDPAHISAIEEEIESTLRDAVESAMSGPDPRPELAWEHVYA
jgi:TPP-dependent pyruvate/acetoin dehydrogenase alpha subunit